MSDCAICYDGCGACRLGCGHVFHDACIEQWYVRGADRVCPLCRHPLRARPEWDDAVKERMLGDTIDEILGYLVDHGLAEMALDEIAEIHKAYDKVRDCSVDGVGLALEYYAELSLVTQYWASFEDAAYPVKWRIRCAPAVPRNYKTVKPLRHRVRRTTSP